MKPPAPQNLTIAGAFQEALRLDKLGRYDDARELCRQIIKAKPDLMDAHHLLGVAALHGGHPADAVRSLKHALKLAPDAPEVAFNLSKAYLAQARWSDVAATLEIVHRLWPDRASILTDMGYALEKMGDDDAAATAYLRALECEPRAASAHANLGAVYTRKGRLAEAKAHLEQALAAQPEMRVALMNLATLHDAASRLDDVIAAYDRVFAQDSNDIYAHFHRALTLLAHGRLQEGWQEYSWRFRRPESRTLDKAFPAPFWQGEPLNDRRLVVWTEQGPGDEILLASMMPELLRKCEHVTLVCSPRLMPVFRRSFPTAAVISTERLDHVGKMGRPDFHASLSHLGAVLRPTMDSFPVQEKYLVADPAKRDRFRASYRNGNTPTKLVGIAWHSANPIAERNKSVALEMWAPILKSIDATFVSLQYGDHISDAKRVSQNLNVPIVIDRSINPLQDMDAFTAQVAAMDAVVSVSNTTVHVAGALGVPTMTMVPAGFGRLWYWFHERSDSPWYSSMRLFRQQSTTDWGQTIDAVAEAVRGAWSAP